MHPNNPMTEGEALAVTARPQDVALLPLPTIDSHIGGVPLWGGNKMRVYALEVATAALASAQAREEELRAEVEMLRSQVRTAANFAGTAQELHQHEKARAERLEEALRYALNQNEHDMVLTGDEIRYARASLSTNAATQPGETNEAAE